MRSSVLKWMLEATLFSGYSLQHDLSYGVFTVDYSNSLFTAPSINLLPGLCETQQSTRKAKRGQQLHWDPLGLLMCGIRWQTRLGFGAVTRVFDMAKGTFSMTKGHLRYFGSQYLIVALSDISCWSSGIHLS